jgi:hypothetical protein
MAAERTAQQVMIRFVSEQDYILRYTELLIRELPLRNQHLLDLTAVLTELEVPCKTASWDRHSQDAYFNALPADSQALDHAIRHDQEWLEKEYPGISMRALTHNKTKHQEYLVSRYGAKLLTESPEKIVEECAASWERKNRRRGSSADTPAITESLKAAIGSIRAGKLRRLLAAKEQLGEIELLARTTRPDAEINFLRQGFILLMTTFDAAIFDVVRVALQKKFFALVGAFGKKKENVTLLEFGELGSWEAIRDQIIEDQLKKRYVKDLLYLLNGEWGVECIDKAAGGKFERLIEFVLRRNVHVHNRGIVDGRYVDEKKNLDGLRTGNVAVIDKPYWQMANHLCRDCVERVAIWADSV